MRFGFKNITDDARHSLEKTGVGINYHSGLFGELVRVDVDAPEDTKVYIMDNKCQYYYLINDVVYTKTDGVDAERLYPRLPPDVLLLVVQENQEGIKELIDNYYRVHVEFRVKPF